ncbi:hypothetical protein C1645_735334 [Glomus cerebriforme]|uniref:BTB domain-containing protein n=1 Tax=Glomus cerebriforme TaxID=658196 RepID=A0A397TFV5_9GLOM|nr:hypothetical protein C1645_735334 [Glomus cerebriforme]
MNSYPTSNTFLWELGSFQHYIKTISNQNKIYSPKFWLPSSPTQCNNTCSNCGGLNANVNPTDIQDFLAQEINPNNVQESFFQSVQKDSDATQNASSSITYNFWQFRMYPNGNIGHENYISLFLKAILTPYEKLHNITSRKQKFLLEIGKLGPTAVINNYGIINVPTSKRIIKQQIFEFTFEFNKVNVTCGFPKFCCLDLLFPDKDKSKEIDLFVQITILSDDSSRSNHLLLLDDYTINKQKQQRQEEEEEEEVKIGDTNEGIYGDIEEYFKNESFTDVEFLFDCGSTLKAHRIILATRCNYFKTMFKSGFKESTLDKVPIRFVRYEVFYVMLYYIYTGRLMDLNEENAYGILRDSYKHSDLMGLTTLKEILGKNIVKFIDNDNWHEILTLGWQFNDLLLRTKGLKYVKENWNIIKYGDNLRDVLNNSGIDCIEELFLVANGTNHMVR